MLNFLIAIAKPISNQLIKHNQYFVFLARIFFLQYFQKYHSFKYSIKVSESLQCFKSAPLHLLIKNWYFPSYGSLSNK